MPRNLDLTSLRSFVTVAETGGVTRASGLLNVTQSAVSMQLKRLEQALGQSLFDRAQRSMALTGAGEQLLGYARRMVSLNDEIMQRMTGDAFVGEIVLGVPQDIVHPAVPRILQAFNARFPRMKVQLISGYTRMLKDMYARGGCDFILTTEDGCEPGGETLIVKPLVWLGAPGGNAWRQRPLPLAFCSGCIFRSGIQRRLDDAGIPWEMAVESESERTVEATVSADLAVHVVIEGTEPFHTQAIAHGGALPEMKSQNINVYRASGARGEACDALAALIRSQISAL